MTAEVETLAQDEELLGYSSLYLETTQTRLEVNLATYKGK